MFLKASAKVNLYFELTKFKSNFRNFYNFLFKLFSLVGSAKVCTYFGSTKLFTKKEWLFQACLLVSF